jgi:predicted helicase
VDTAFSWVRDADADTTIEKGDRLEQFTAYVAVPSVWPAAQDIRWLGHGVDELTGQGQGRADVSFEVHGERYFVQCKNEVERLGEATAERYNTAFERRRTAGGYRHLVIVSANGFSAPAAAALAEHGATMIGPEILDEIDIDLADFLALCAAATPAPTPVVRKEPFPHNAQAIEAIVAFDGVRGVVCRPTGSGKTIVQAGVIDGLTPASTLVLVPSIELIRQLVRSYTADLPGYRFLAVFSGKLPEDLGGLAGGIEATTNAAVVRSFVRATSEPWVIVSTYQSYLDVVVPGVDRAAIDLGLFDEAHRTATGETSSFTAGLSDDYLTMHRRFFFTATPKVAALDLRDAAEGAGVELTIASMDDVKLYGPLIPGAQLTLTDAIAQGVVSPFDVIVGIIDEPTVHNTVHGLLGGRHVTQYTDRFGDPDDRTTWTSITDVAQALYFLAQLTPGQSALTFHNSIERSKRMCHLLEALCVDAGIPAIVDSVDGTSSLRRRRAAVKLLADKDPHAIHIVTNCQLFTEGIDTPALDAVCFFDPKQSTIGIVQAIGRALRTADGKGRAKVILPVFAPSELDAETFVRQSRYGNLFTVGLALRDAGVILREYVHVVQDRATPIIRQSSDLAPGVYVTVPAAYDHLVLTEAIRSLVIGGDPSRIDEDRAYQLLLDYLATHGAIVRAEADDDAAWILRQCERYLPTDKRFPAVITAGGP